MTKETVEFDGEKILISLYEKYKQQSWVLSNKDIEDKCNQWFGGGKFKNFKINLYKGRHKFGFNCGITFNEHQELDFVFDSDDREYTLHVCKLSLKKLFDKIKISDNKLVIIYGAISRKDIKISNEEKQFFNEFFEQCEKEAEIVFNQFKEKLIFLVVNSLCRKKYPVPMGYGSEKFHCTKHENKNEAVKFL